MNMQPENLEAVISLLNKDLREASKKLSDKEVRFLVDAYYQMQENRIRSEAQIRAMAEEPHGVLIWLAKQNRIIENQLKLSLDIYSYNHPVGLWARSIRGIGPVIAAGFLAHIDITKAPTAGNIWSFAGLNPKVSWEKGQKRPWNATLKVLCWKLGESFVKVSGHEDAVYGQLYKERKALEIEMNEKGELAEKAKGILAEKKFKDDTVAKSFYEKGMLPPAHIHARAKRFAVKMFISHLHEVWYQWHFKVPAPNPYVIEHLGHAHKMEPPIENRPY